MDTEAVKVLADFKDKLSLTIEILTSLVVDEPVGFSSFGDDYKCKLREVFAQLLDIRSKFK